jgi:hypothetical protein
MAKPMMRGALADAVLRLRATEEPVEVVAVLDASGTMLVRDVDGALFEARPEDVQTERERNACSCCG